MRVLLTQLASATLILLTACGSDPAPSDADLCRGMTCPEGYDCVAGQCVFREEPEPLGCESNNDCQFSPGGALCERESGRCVQCLETTHCPAGRVCEVGICVGSVCTTDDDCDEATPICTEDGSACVECVGSDDCEEGEACNGGSCVPQGCVDHDTCAALDPDLPYCGESGDCVACTAEAGCEEGEVCVAGSCQTDAGCSSHQDCDGDPAGSLCDLQTGACVVCVDDSSCTFPDRCVDQAACEPRSCDDFEDCPTGTACDDGTCRVLGPCGSDEDCTLDPRVPRCSLSSVCVECIESSECGLGRICNAAGSCVDAPACGADSECTGGFVCTSGSCNACRADAQCPRGSCVDGSCVDRASCTTDRDCSSGLCDGGSCVECASDLHCRPGLWCESGACVEAATCDSNEACGPGRLCDGFECQDAACADDSFEPDDGPAFARPIRLGDVNVRSLCPNDEDWFTFTAAAGAGIQVTFPTAVEGVGASLVWFDPADGARREQGMVEGNLRQRTLPPAAAGRYYLVVRGARGASGTYGLLAELTGGGCEDPLEPNNTWNVAKRIPTDTWLDSLTLCSPTDQDFYMVTLPAGRSIRAYAVLADGEASVSILTGAGSNLQDQRSRTVPYMGGARVGEWDGGLAEDVDRMIRIVPGAPLPSSYRLYVATVPADACTSPDLLLDEGEDRGRVASATLGYETPTDAGVCGRVGPQASYEVRLDEDRRVVASVTASFDATLALLESSCGAEQSCIPTASGSIGTLDLSRVDAGTYTLVVSADGDQAGPFDLALRTLPPLAAPTNDRCEQPQSIPGLGPTTVSISGTTAGASAAGAEGLCMPHAPDVYYSFTLAAPARLVASAQGDAPLSLALLEDDCLNQVDCTSDGTIDRELEAGDHLLRVASTSGAATAFTLDLTLPPTHPNDGCGGALPVAIPSTTAGDTTWARDDLSFDLVESCTGYFTLGNDLFYSVSLGAGESLTARLQPGEGFDPALYLIRSCGAPQCLVGSDRPGAGVEEEIDFTATQAGDYLLVVDGAKGGGTFTLEVE